MLNVDQTFLKTDSRERVIKAMNRSLEEWPQRSNAEAPEGVRYSGPDTKKERYFYVSLPSLGWVCILECGGGDERLARELSSLLGAKAIWLVYSETTEEILLSRFDGGRVVEETKLRPPTPTKKKVLSFIGTRPLTPPERSLRALAEEVYTQFALPWQFYDYSHIRQAAANERSAYFVAKSFGR